MGIIEDIALAAVRSNEKFKEALKQALKELGLSIVEFSRISGVSQSTLYKTLSKGREPNLRTVRQIVKAINALEKKDRQPFIALIASRPFLNKVTRTTAKVMGREVMIQEYPANSIEEAIIAAVKAEREGAQAIVCAPIVSSTIEKILHIPIVTIMPKDGLKEAINIAVKKVF